MAGEGAGRNGKRFQPWLEQQLNLCTIPGLKWVDRAQKIFRLPWKQNRPALDGEQDAYVLLQYAIALHQHENGMPLQYSRWKTLMRNALRSLPYIKELRHLHKQDREQPYNVYQFVDASSRAAPAKKRRCDESVAVDGLDFPTGGNAHLGAEDLPTDSPGEFFLNGEQLDFLDDFIDTVTSGSSSELSQDPFQSSPLSNVRGGHCSGSQIQPPDNGGSSRNQIPITSSDQNQIVPQSLDSRSLMKSTFLQAGNLAGGAGFPSLSQLQVDNFLDYGGFCGASARHENPFSVEFASSSQTGFDATGLHGDNAFGKADQSLGAARAKADYTNSAIHANIPNVVTHLNGLPLTSESSGIPNFGRLLSQNNDRTEATETVSWAGEFVQKKDEAAPPSAYTANQTQPMGLDTHQSHAHQQVPVDQLTVYWRNSEYNDGIVNGNCASTQPIQNGHVWQAGAQGHSDQLASDVFNNSISITVHYFTSPILKKICEAPFRFCFDGSGIEANVLAKYKEAAGQEVKEVVKLPTIDECNDLDPNGNVSKLEGLLNNMEVGVIISYKNNDIYARRLCKAHILFFTPGETPVSLPRREERKIFSFNDHFKPRFEACRMSRQESKHRFPEPFVYLTFGRSKVHSSSFPHTSLITVQVIHLLASKMLRDVAEDEFSKSNSDFYDHCIDLMRTMTVNA